MTQQSALFRDPITTNLATPQQWSFYLKRTPSLSYHCQRVKLPDVSFPPPEASTPFLDIPEVGDHLRYGPLAMEFKIDADFQNWQEIFNWIRGISDPDGTGIVYTDLQNAPMGSPYTLRSDMSVIQTDSQNNPILTWTFHGAYPFALTGPQFDATDTEVKYLTSTAQFRYVTYDLKIPV